MPPGSAFIISAIISLPFQESLYPQEQSRAGRCAGTGTLRAWDLWIALHRPPVSPSPPCVGTLRGAMEDPFSLDTFSPVLNLSSALQPGWSLNLSSSPGDRWPSLSQQVRVISAAAILLLGLVGNCLVLHRLCCCGRSGRRRKMDFLIGHLALADLYGCGLALLSHLTAELLGAAWPAGDAACRLLKLLQGSGLLASSNVLVLIALERHHVVRQPAAHPPLPARALATLGWLLALLLALPQAFVFRLASRPGGSRCLSIFEQLPRWHGQAYGVYGAVTSFLAPVCLLCWAYGRILLALWAAQEQKPPAAAERGEGSGGRRRRVGLPAARSLLLRLPAASCPMPRARVKTLQLTLVLIALFALCRLPRFVLELSLAFGPGGEAPAAAGLREARAALGIVAVTNSALNPYAYLLFQSHRPWARRLQRSLCRAGPGPACCCPGPEGEPRRRPNHRALQRHRPKNGPPAGAQRAALCSPALPPGSGPQELVEAATSACESGF
ncbi:LOW QUALITY PROTEIN: probable G-protein coupled receptor 150 [Emydura macquarii macquarii]|uniref:LOW QUALITY PROTEIN: probable G-protein coupled receptor 150 n=1 Tax=Emydura macquarii macquarii TaxID=1129001 RepID=UPI00352A5603